LGRKKREALKEKKRARVLLSTLLLTLQATSLEELANFFGLLRKYGKKGSSLDKDFLKESHLTVPFHKHLNVLIGITLILFIP